MPRGRSAFTLIELLVVLGLFLLLMGLTAASVTRTPKVNRMVAAEHAVADAIRQARHTARTGGQPVILRLRENERTISGVVRTSLWHALEGWPEVSDDGVAMYPLPGRTGTGLSLPAAYSENGEAGRPLDSAAANNRMASMPDLPLEGSRRLWRGTADRRAGIMISVAVKPPIAGESGSPDILPLVMVGPDETPDPSAGSDFARYDQALLGLLLVNTGYQPGTSGTPPASNLSVAASWEILGWVGTEASGGTRIEVSSIDDKPTQASTGLTSAMPADGNQSAVQLVIGGVKNSTGFAEAGPLVGGRWTELSLLIDGDRMSLYRDGRLVGAVAAASTATTTEPDAEHVYVGVAKVPGVNGGAALVATNAVLDDVRLERLGDAMSGVFPPGVSVGPRQAGKNASRSIICHPDGRVAVVWEDPTNAPSAPAVINPIQLTDADGGMTAEIEIGSTGDVVASRTEVAP